MEWYEAAFDRFYPLVYAHRDITEAEKVVEAFADIFEGKEPILDLACGNGRYIEAFSRIGCHILGLDLSHYLLKECVDSWGHNDVLVQGDMRFLPYVNESIGSIISMFTSFGYFSRDTDNLISLREIHRVLKAGGLFLLDFLNARRIKADLLDRTLSYRNGFRIEQKRSLDDKGKYIRKDIKLHDLGSSEEFKIVELLRLYTKEDLLNMFERMGLRVIDVYGDYLRNPFVEGVSERVIVLAEKAY